MVRYELKIRRIHSDIKRSKNEYFANFEYQVSRQSMLSLVALVGTVVWNRKSIRVTLPGLPHFTLHLNLDELK